MTAEPERIPAPDPVVVEVVRNGLVESSHRGAVAVTDAGGTLAHAVGDAGATMYPRSSNKPVQAAAMVASGLDLDGALVALVAGSHSGEPFHIDGVRTILAGAGLDESALQCPADYPLDEAAREAVIRAGGTRAPVLMNCSGKHAGMLATCVLNGWSTHDYLDPAHPLQRAIADRFATLTDDLRDPVAVDGCGAPIFATSLTGLARAFGRLAAAPDDTPEGRVASAIRAHPEYTSGTTRDERDLIAAVPGLVGKGGAEAVYAIGFADGRGVAVKIDDGGYRARPVLMAAVLRTIGVTGEVVDRQAEEPVLGGGHSVGAVRPAAALARLDRSS